jgi:ketosteroid isomerase-like protein
MDAKEELIRKFYEARRRCDWTAVRDMLAPDVTWLELGPEQTTPATTADGTR